MTIVQHGSQLRAGHAAKVAPAAGYLAQVESANGLLRLEVPGAGEEALGFWEGGTAPDWADDWDGYGAWLRFSVEGRDGRWVSQRMRWIPLGRFRMGSPPDEQSPFSFEICHAAQVLHDTRHGRRVRCR